jgi:cytochrome c553
MTMNIKLGKLALAFVAIGLAVAYMAIPVVAQRGATRPRVQLPQGPVRDIILKNCTECHGIDDFAFFSQDRPAWEKLIRTKHKDGDFSVSDKDRSLLLDWIVSKFGPDTKPFPRTYIAPEITKFFSDPEATRLLDRACTSCHDSERINKERRTEEGWRVLVLDMRERGAKLSDEEIEQVSEWLGRVKGTNQSQ